MNKKKVFKNSLWLSGGQGAARVIGFFYYILLARYLGVAEFGVWNWVLGLGYNFYPLADFGIERYVLKYLPRNPEKKNDYLSRLLPLRLFLAIGSVLLSSVLALVLGSKTKAVYMLIFGLGLIPHNLIFLYASIKNALEKMHIFGIATIGCSLGYTLTGMLMIHLNLGIGWLFSSFFIGNGITFLILTSLIRRYDLKIKWKWDVNFYKKVLSESWAFGLLLVVAVFYIRISLVLMGVLGNDYQTGIYGSASKFIEAGILFPQSIAIALFPSFSKMFFENKNRLKKTYLKSLPLLFLISIPVFLVMWYGGQYIIPFVYGVEYTPAIPVFKLMGVLMIFFFVNSLADNIIQNSQRVVDFLPWRILNFLVSLTAGIILIPKIGVIGGVWTLIIGEIFGFAVNNLYVAKLLNGKEDK